MKNIIEIELIGDNVDHILKMFRDMTNELSQGYGDATFGGTPKSGWIAEITGFDPKYHYSRLFLRYHKDYSRANKKGSRGVFAEYTLESGRIYDVKDGDRRYFCNVNDDGDIVRMEESEVIAWLKSRSA
jgi:hypothetical protein